MESFIPGDVTLVLVDKSTGASIRLPQSMMVIEVREDYGTTNMMSDKVLGPPKATEITVEADFLTAFREAQNPTQIEERRQIGGSDGEQA